MVGASSERDLWLQVLVIVTEVPSNKLENLDVGNNISGPELADSVPTVGVDEIEPKKVVKTRSGRIVKRPKFLSV